MYEYAKFFGKSFSPATESFVHLAASAALNASIEPSLKNKKVSGFTFSSFVHAPVYSFVSVQLFTVPGKLVVTIAPSPSPFVVPYPI